MRNGLSADLIARVLGAAPAYTIAELEAKYPARNLPAEAMVTRFAPSPTGFFHTGNLYPALVDKKLAQQSNGIFYLRIEDTDTEREVPGAVDIVVNSLAKFGLNVDEGMVGENKEIGDYGPYTQSKRKDVYHSVVAELLADGRAYPCFLSADEINEIREAQSKNKIRPGIYAEFARDRNLSNDEIIAKLDMGIVPTIRLYSPGDANKKVYCKEAIRGSVEFPENIDDAVLIKSNDGLPTYHFAHLCDDHFMRTTHVFRDVSWLPSLPLHVQMFNMMGWELPIYFHHATIDVLDEETGGRRKLSKRKDRAAGVDNLLADGWAPESVIEYLFNIVASGYEEAKLKGQVNSPWEYTLNVKRLPASGALFDMKKLEWWAREFVATLSAEELSGRITNWVNEYGTENQKSEIRNQKYLIDILAIERDGVELKKRRKDFITWSQTLEQIEFFFDDVFTKREMRNAKCENNNTHLASRISVLEDFLCSYDSKDQKDIWWGKIVKIAEAHGIKNGDVAMALRVALTGRTMAPDLYSVMQVMGESRVKERIAAQIGE